MEVENIIIIVLYVVRVKGKYFLLGSRGKQGVVGT